MQESLSTSPSFRSKSPRILLLTSQYFLVGELQAALGRLGIEHLLLDLGAREMDLDEFVVTMTETLDSFRPDYVLTVNHLGVDREGVLATLLDRHKVPLASWFVDNPHLILNAYDNLHGCKTVLFTWDSDNIPSLKALGFRDVFHLPLGADPTRLKPSRTAPVADWQAPISFVGNSMLTKTIKRIEAAMPTKRLLEGGMEVARAFSESDAPLAKEFLYEQFPELVREFEGLAHPGRKQAYLTFITWQATLLYRLDCVQRIMDFSPLIVGDKGWLELLKNREGWRYHAELSYYDDLPDFYPSSRINFNCTSRQMMGAVNQRVFDVPCCGAFLLTDHRDHLEDLFEPGTEVICYHQPDEIPGLVDVYLADDKARQDVADAARKRVLAEHTYDHRMTSLMEIMRRTLG